MYSDVLDRNLWMSFTFNPCNYMIEVNVENINKKYEMLNYNWGNLYIFIKKIAISV
jgi:hypothetical protein